MMNRKKLITVAALAVLALACSEAAGGMMEDAGAMLADAGDVVRDAGEAIRDAGDVMRDAGDVMQPDAGAQDTPVECNKSDTKRYDEGESSARTVTTRYAEFEVTPGETEVTTCTAGDPDAYWPTSRRDRCYRGKAGWYRGTSTGFVLCGAHTDWDDDERFTDSNTPDPLSITVHN